MSTITSEGPRSAGMGTCVGRSSMVARRLRFDFGKMVPDPSSGGGGGKDTTACNAIRGAKRPLRGSVNDTRVKWLYHHGDRVTKRRDVEERRERLAFRRRWLIHHGLR